MNTEETIQELVLACKEGDMDSTYRLWQKFRPLCIKWAYTTHLAGYDTSDLYQQTYIELITCLEKYDFTYGVPFEAYYQRHLRGWRANQLRKSRENLCTDIGVEMLLQERPDETIDIAKAIEDKLMLSEINQVLKALTPWEQTIIIEHYFCKQTVKDIAKAHGMHYNTFKYHLKKIMKKIKNNLPT